MTVDTIAATNPRAIREVIHHAWRGGRSLDGAIDHAAYTAWTHPTGRWAHLQKATFENTLTAFRRVFLYGEVA